MKWGTPSAGGMQRQRRSGHMATRSSLLSSSFALGKENADIVLAAVSIRPAGMLREFRLWHLRTVKHFIGWKETRASSHFKTQPLKAMNRSSSEELFHAITNPSKLLFHFVPGREWQWLCFSFSPLLVFRRKLLAIRLPPFHSFVRRRRHCYKQIQTDTAGWRRGFVISFMGISQLSLMDI